MDDDAPTKLHAQAHEADGLVGPHGSMADHGETHGHDDHGHVAETLGPVDRGLWGAAGLGIVLGVVVAVALAIGAGFQLSIGG